MLSCPECSLLFSGTRWVLTLSDDLYLYLMNNFINFSRKAARDTLERRVVSASSKNIPNIEQYVSRYRYPLIPKIVVYSASSSSDSLLSKYILVDSGPSPSSASSLPPSPQKPTKSSLAESQTNSPRPQKQNSRRRNGPNSDSWSRDSLSTPTKPCCLIVTSTELTWHFISELKKRAPTTYRQSNLCWTTTTKE